MDPNTIDAGQRLDKLDTRGNWVYPSGSESGHVEIMVPSLPGSPRETETLHARDFGPHVVSRIEASMNRQGYLRSGPQQTAAQTLRHYVAVAKGASLMDRGAIGRMEKMAGEFEVEPNQQDYFELVVKPYLYGLKPTKRR